jgi:hypothetical protein
MYAKDFRQTPSGETRMTFSAWVRQSHRWLGIIFTLTVLANFAVRAFQEPPAWITYSPLPPLFLQLLGGLYLFFLPYARRRRAQ